MSTDEIKHNGMTPTEELEYLRAENEWIRKRLWQTSDTISVLVFVNGGQMEFTQEQADEALKKTKCRIKKVNGKYIIKSFQMGDFSEDQGTPI